MKFEYMHSAEKKGDIRDSERLRQEWIAELNRLGSEGWEVFKVDDCFANAMLKRVVQN